MKNPIDISKSTIITIVILVLVGKMSICQEYTEFYLEDAEWYIGFDEWAGSDRTYNSSFRYVTYSDTVIDGDVYKNLYSQSLCSYIIGSDGIKHYYTLADTIFSLIGALREEEKKVYYYQYPGRAIGKVSNIENNTPYLLYDFSVGEGDTVFHGVGTYTIMGEEIGSHVPRRYKATPSVDTWPNNHFILVEGIGSDRGLLSPLELYGEFLDCFRVMGDEISFYYCDRCPEPTINVGVGELGKIPIPLIYPNPVMNELYIEMEDRLPKKIFIYSNVGRVVKVDYLNEMESKIIVNDLSSGVYFLKIENVDGDVANFKFIKL